MVEAKLPTLDQIKKQIPARCFEVCRGDDGTITSRLAERTLPCLSCGLDASSDDSLGYRAYVCGAEEPVALLVLYVPGLRDLGGIVFGV
jgi:hypothetical protein